MSKQTEDDITLRYIHSRFGTLGTDRAYERYMRYLHWFRTGEWIKLEADND